MTENRFSIQRYITKEETADTTIGSDVEVIDLGIQSDDVDLTPKRFWYKKIIWVNKDGIHWHRDANGTLGFVLPPGWTVEKVPKEQCPLGKSRIRLIPPKDPS